jgi:hypothetical protein
MAGLVEEGRGRRERRKERRERRERKRRERRDRERREEGVVDIPQSRGRQPLSRTP